MPDAGRPDAARPDAALPEFQRYQFAFAAHIRDPRGAPRPDGVPARRMKVYNALLYDNTESFLLGCFPVLRRCLGARRWTRLYREFFRVHRSHTPYFRQIPEEFLRFLQDEWSQPDDYPAWVLELAHYEWIELALAVSDREPDVAVDADGDLLDGVPVLNPVLANLAYAWPVQRLRPRVRVAPEPTCILLFRDAADEVRFNVLNPFSARLVALLGAGDATGRAALLQLVEESGHPDPDAVLAGGAALLADLRAQGAILGVRAG